MDCWRRRSESFWHTTRVVPVPVVESAEASDRGVGTAPPAHGFTEQSGAGSGQYEARSMWAEATAGRISAPTTAAQSPRRASLHDAPRTPGISRAATYLGSGDRASVAGLGGGQPAGAPLGVLGSRLLEDLEHGLGGRRAVGAGQRGRVDVPDGRVAAQRAH